MGVLLQLMAMPAACLLFAWARRGGRKSAVASALRRMLALMAVRDTARARFAAGGASVPAKTGRKVVRLARPTGAVRRALSKAGRLPGTTVSPRAPGVDDPLLRMRRIRLRWAGGNP